MPSPRCERTRDGVQRTPRCWTQTEHRDRSRWQFCMTGVVDEGVHHAMRLLADEVDRDMALLGVCSIAELRDQMPLLLPADWRG